MLFLIVATCQFWRYQKLISFQSSKFGLHIIHGQRRRSRTWELDPMHIIWLLTVTLLTEWAIIRLSQQSSRINFCGVYPTHRPRCRCHNDLQHFHDVWRRCSFSVQSKIRLYSACVMTALLYGCETQTLNKHKWAKVKAFLMRYLLTDLQLNDMQAYTYAFCCLVRAAYTFNKDHLLTYLLMYVRTYLLMPPMSEHRKHLWILRVQQITKKRDTKHLPRLG